VHVQESWVALHSLMPVCPCLDLAICFASGGRRDWSNLPRAPVGKSTPSRWSPRYLCGHECDLVRVLDEVPILKQWSCACMCCWA